ncbi:MAG: hypothetical protein AAF628_36735, partial [Planctomycetota bacterium]
MDRANFGKPQCSGAEVAECDEQRADGADSALQQPHERLCVPLQRPWRPDPDQDSHDRAQIAR